MMAEPLLKDQDDENFESAGFFIERSTDLSKLSDKNKGAMSTLKQVLASEGTHSDIYLLMVGKTGQGKSTLINSLIELGEDIAQEGAETDMCTRSTHSYVHPELLPDVKVRIVDSPGLQDIHVNEQLYIEDMKVQCQEVSLVLYCMKMTNHRLAYDDTLALHRLHQAFGPTFWKRVVFVLTFANNERCEQKDSRDEDGPEPPFTDQDAWAELIRKRFIHRVQLRSDDINAFLKRNCETDEYAHFVPAGHYKPNFYNPNPLKLPDRDNWLHNLMKSVHSQIKKHNFSRLNLNDKIHLAFIVDNHGEVKVEEDGAKTINDDAKEFIKTLENLGFCTLYFNTLSSQSVSTLLEMLLHINASQLATFAFVLLSKGKTRQLYDCNNEIIYTDNIFEYFRDDQSHLALVPKIFYFSLAHIKEPSERLQFSSVLPKNSIALITSVDQNSSSVVLKTVSSKLTHEASIQQCCSEIHKDCNRKHDKVFCVYIDNFTEKFVLPARYVPFHSRAEKEYYKKQLELYRSMWYPIRCKTISVLSDNKEAVLSIVRHERIARIAASSASIVLGGGMVVAGLALLPFTFGVSIGLSVAGGVVGATASLGGIGAFIASKILSNKRLKLAQEHISLDQQLSISINNVAAKYNEAMKKCVESALDGGELAGNVAAGGAGLASLGRVGMGIAIGIESAAEVGAIALRTGARTLGVVLAGASLAVTVPIDLGFIVYHSYHIHKSSKDKTGKADSNKVVQWLIKQTEDMLKDTCGTIELKQHSIEGGMTSTLENTDCGYKMIIPVATEEESSINVRTIFSGPFVLPDGYTIVSAIYDISLPEQLSKPVTVKLEHCVDLNDEITASKMCFATAAIDLEKKVFVFDCVEKGSFPRGETYASLDINDSCLLCVLYSGSTRDTSMKYAGQCSYVRDYKNSWTMSILFTKHLSAHYKYTQSETVGTIESHPFLFTTRKGDGELLMELNKFKSQMDLKGWKVAPLTPIPDVILKSQIDCVELQQEFGKLQCRIIPSIEFSVYVYDEDTATDEIDKYLDIGGTTSDIFIKRQRE
ncbi:PREDICTED: uncharacterized protein LOC109588224 [Amphimedon queenslandica]|uniref:Caspase family p20 domain-containing protein n=1 Tax=Amphimedon queenslandica TaxID=400682 RepID=A0AAN0JSU7_AMPQE|nr:PREDICTED: uncharacterized protein LOC109588224 [Amphimedon queenslandica]|eukprot:XP_019859962.1 PREDICTED: uncharacterized protein LOC109588224 [Amphimedon queenslandica]